MLAAELVPTAFGILKAAEGEPMRSIIAAVNIGGDTDTLAAIIGGITGAMYGPGIFPPEIVSHVEKINNLDLGKIATGLAEITAERMKNQERNGVSDLL